MAALLAAPLLLVFTGTLTANPPKQCYFGGQFCMSLFSKMHQHGPLFNYGPYYGYPPFEPYGPWNAYLQYNPWYYGSGGGGGGGAHGGGHNLFHGKHGGLLHGGHGGHGCGSCGFHANWLHGGWFRGHGCVSCGSHSLFHHGRFAGHGCSSCGKSGLHDGKGGHCKGCKADASPAADPLTRFAGAGSPADSAGFYAAIPTLTPDAVTPAGVR
jgi:hypothetical protein